MSVDLNELADQCKICRLDDHTPSTLTVGICQPTSEAENSQTQHSLYTRKESRNVESLKEDLSGHVFVLSRIERGFCQENGVLCVSEKSLEQKR